MKELTKNLLSSFKGVLQGTGSTIRHPIEKFHRLTDHVSFWRRESTDDKFQDILSWITTNPLVSALISGIVIFIFSTLTSLYLESKKRKNEENQEKILLLKLLVKNIDDDIRSLKFINIFLNPDTFQKNLEQTKHYQDKVLANNASFLLKEKTTIKFLEEEEIELLDNYSVRLNDSLDHISRAITTDESRNHLLLTAKILTSTTLIFGALIKHELSIKYLNKDQRAADKSLQKEYEVLINDSLMEIFKYPHEYYKNQPNGILISDLLARLKYIKEKCLENTDSSNHLGQDKRIYASTMSLEEIHNDPLIQSLTSKLPSSSYLCPDKEFIIFEVTKEKNLDSIMDSKTRKLFFDFLVNNINKDRTIFGAQDSIPIEEIEKIINTCPVKSEIISPWNLEQE